MSAQTKGYFIIDTREPYEYVKSHIEGAINISPLEFMNGSFAKKLEGVAKDVPILLYCLSGARSNTCGMILSRNGYTNLTNGVNEGRVRQMLKG